MAMEFDVYSRVNGFTYENTALIDSFKSLIIDDKFQDANDFELVVAYTIENALLYVPETLLKIKGVFYYIDDVIVDNLESHQLFVSGRSLAAKAYDRIIDGNYMVTAQPERIAADIFKKNVSELASAARKFDYLTLPTQDIFSGFNIPYQKSYGSIGEEIALLMQSYDFGMKETSVAGKVGNVVSFVKGTDYSKTIEISTDFENLLKAGYTNSTADFKTYAVTLGEGEGSDRARYDFTPQDKPVHGIERRELYVDARDLQRKDSDTEKLMSSAEYKNALKVRATEKLQDRQRILSLKGSLNVHDKLYRLGVDFGLGDTVTIKSSLFGVSNTAMITAIKYTYDETGEYVEPTFGKQTPTIIDKLKRK